MKAAEDGRRCDAAHVLDRAIDRGVLVERSMSPQLIIIDGIRDKLVTGVQTCALPIYGRLFVCGDQSGRTSAPIRPHAVQTIDRKSVV